MQGFYEIANFPGVLGAIDCTHVAIQSPGGEYAELYRNRKGYFSINVQAICNSCLEFTNIVARWSGSSHDVTIFGNSRICAQFESGEITGILLGDGGYGCKKYLLTPLPPQILLQKEGTTLHKFVPEILSNGPSEFWNDAFLVCEWVCGVKKRRHFV